MAPGEQPAALGPWAAPQAREGPMLRPMLRPMLEPILGPLQAAQSQSPAPQAANRMGQPLRPQTRQRALMQRAGPALVPPG